MTNSEATTTTDRPLEDRLAAAVFADLDRELAEWAAKNPQAASRAIARARPIR